MQSERRPAAHAIRPLERRHLLVGVGLGISSAALPAAASAASGGFALSATAQFDQPTGVAVTASGDVYVADSGNDRIRRVTGAGVVSTVLDGGGSAGIQRVAIDGTTLYFTAMNEHVVGRVTGGVPVLIAGEAGAFGSVDGTGDVARFSSPGGLAFGPDGTLYVVDAGSDQLRSIVGAAAAAAPGDTTVGTVSTLSTGLSFPEGALFQTGRVVVANAGAANILAIDPSDGSGTVLADPGDPGFSPRGVAPDGVGGLYVVDSGSHSVLRVSADGSTVTVVAGPWDEMAPSPGFVDGTGTAARFDSPMDIARHPGTGDLYVADSGNHVIRRVTPAGVVTTFAGTGVPGFADD